MGNWSNPLISTAYTTFLSELKARDEDAATMFDVGSPTNVPTDAIKFAKSSGVFQKWTGAAWSTVQLKTAAIENNAITTALIADGNVTSGKLASGAAASNLGFTPANKAGDTFTGAISVSAAAPQVSLIESDNSNKTWLLYLNSGTFGIYEDTTGSARLTIAAGASTLALSSSNVITYNGNSIWHAGNDGAGSGLDADTTDGQHLGTGHTVQFGALGIGVANDGTQALAVASGSMASNSARQIAEWTGSNTTQTLTANRVHHGLLSTFSNVHFDASGFTLGVYGAEVNAVSGGTSVAAKAAALVGGYFTATNATDQATNNVVTSASALKGLLKSSHANALITTGYGLDIEINSANASSITTAYLAYLSYTGTAPTNRRGVRLVGEDYSQFDGSLGLGIVPTQKLHVSGNVLGTGTITAGTQLFGGGSQGASAPDFSFTGDTNTGFRRTAADAIALVTNSADRLSIDSAGLVGINTAPATYQLSVGGSLNATAISENGTALSSTYARLGVSNALTVGGHTITTAGLTTYLSFVSTDATAADWSAVVLDRQSSSPAAADILASIVFTGKNTGSAAKNYAAIQSEIVDPTAATEDGKLAFRTMVAGTDATRAYIAQGVVIGSPTSGDLGVGTLNATALYYNGKNLAGKQTIILPASAFYPRTTSGAGAASFETTTNKVMLKGWAFDASLTEYVQTMFSMPKSWNKGTIDLTLRMIRHAGAAANQVRFGARAVILDSGDAMDAAFGTAVEGNVTPSATADVQFELVLSGITPAGTTSAANSTIVLEIYRDIADAADAENTNDIILLEAFLTYTTNSPVED